jgi:hypothetical protein
MINWPTELLLSQWLGGMATWRPVTLPEEKVTIIALSNKYDNLCKETLFGDYPSLDL